jgi:hypothetical protein
MQVYKVALRYTRFYSVTRGCKQVLEAALRYKRRTYVHEAVFPTGWTQVHNTLYRYMCMALVSLKVLSSEMDPAEIGLIR